MNINAFLYKKSKLALMKVCNSDCFDIQIKRSKKNIFGDYQIYGIINIANKLKISSYLLAKKLVLFLDINEITKKIDVIKPGFINIFLSSKWIAKVLSCSLYSSRLGVMKTKKPITIVVDYSSPNLAKEMHVGHLRSTIIGDAVVRVLLFIGHKVIRANHVGDWGTQFGMLLAYLDEISDIKNKYNIKLSYLEQYYKIAKKKFDTNNIFAKKARDYVVKLQSGDTICINIWKKIVSITMHENQIIYNRLNVTLTSNDTIGESFYNSMLPNIVQDLLKKSLATKVNGAIVVYLDNLNKCQKNEIIIQKKDGAYLYTTTDIACVKYRYEYLKADRILYYVDSRQKNHLKQSWYIARKAGYIPNDVSLEHHMLGMMLNNDGKPFQTRSGESIKLKDFLDEALSRSKKLILKKYPNIDDNNLERLSEVIGIGAIKYADLSKHRATDYMFNWDEMISFDGNTAPYIQYAYSRVISLLKKSGYDSEKLMYKNINISINLEYERQLGIKLLQFEEIILLVSTEGIPHMLCSYLYSLATLFSTFYENCTIIDNNNVDEMQSKLKLSLLTAYTLKKGLELLGINISEKM